MRPVALSLSRLLGAIGLAGAVLLTPSAGRAQTHPCHQGVVTGAGAVAGRIQICTPELQATIDQLLANQSASDDRQRELVRLIENANAAALRLDERTEDMARSLSKRLGAVDYSTPSGLRDVRRLTDQLEAVVERLAAVEAAPQRDAATQTLGRAVGDAVVALDLDLADQLINGIESIQKQLGEVKQEVRDVGSKVERGNHFEVLTRVSQDKPKGDLGQVAALGALAASNSFEGFDFSGMNLKDVKASGLKAAEADFTLARLEAGELREADLHGTRLIAASLEQADLSGARLRSARAALAQARKAVLKNADLSLGSWMGADLREADLRSADLRGASLEHADLRGADLRGADLRDTFLGNADLRDARLEGAVFSNTDVLSALISFAQLDDAQRSGLCATRDAAAGANTGVWIIVEAIPSSRFSGGYEYRRIFEERDLLYSGSTLAAVPYAECAQAADEARVNWNTPVSGGRLSGSFGFEVAHALLERANRREDLLARIGAVQSAAAARHAELLSMPQFEAKRAELIARVEERARRLMEDPRPAAIPSFDADTRLLLALRIRPKLLDELDFDWNHRGVQQAGLSEHLGIVDMKQPAPWPRLFPAGMSRGDTDATTAAIFERWTRARSRALPDLRVLIPWSAGMPVYSGRRGTKNDALASALGVDSGSLTAFAEHWSVFPAGRPVSTALLLGAPAPADVQEGLLTATVEDVRTVRTVEGPYEREYVVWTLRPEEISAKNAR